MNTQSKRAVLLVFLALWAVNMLQHVPSFHRTTFLGDEAVYLSLASEMNWDTSNFTTRAVPGINGWPNSIYRQPLFHQGPVLPYVLKVGLLFESPAIAGFLFANLCFAIYYLSLWRFFEFLAVPPLWRLWAFIGAASDPLLLFSTTRLHNDATSGLLLAAGLIFCAESMIRRSLPLALFGGLLLSVAMNLRPTAILATPILVAFQLCYIRAVSLSAIKNDPCASAREGLTLWLHQWRAWRSFVVISFIVVSMGLWHAWRLVYTYGTIIPGSFAVPDVSDPWYQMLSKRSPGMMLANMVVLTPMLVIALTPPFLLTVLPRLRRGEWVGAFQFSFLFVFVAVFMLSHHELRYFALALPLFYCCLPCVVGECRGRWLYFMLALGIFALFSHWTTGAIYTLIRPNQGDWIVPALYEFVPALMRFYGPTGV